MAVNLIDNEEIHVIQNGSDITLDIQNDALKNEDVVVGSIRSKNMFDKNAVILNQRLSNTGNPYYDSNYVLSNFIEAKPSTEYTYSRYTNGAQYSAVAFYDNEQTFISRTLWENYTTYTSITFSIPSNAYYIRICDFKTLINNMQIEEGSISTAYSPYQNLTGEENYSTGEQRIGTWIDGKPLYRKTVVISGLPNDAEQGYPHNISNIDQILKIYGIANSGGTSLPIPNTSVKNPSYTINCYRQDNYLYIETNRDRTNYTAYITLEYTKTTD